MKALLCTEFGPPEALKLVDLPSPRAGENQAVVTMKAAALNFLDTLIIEGKYQVKPSLPFSPGAEMAGVVKEVGPAVTAVKPGDHVVCRSSFGCLAEEVIAETESLIPIPDEVDWLSAAALTVTYSTALQGLRDRARFKPGERLVVLGAAGGVGTAAIQVGKALGARVIACASGRERLELCRSLGADQVVDYGNEDLKERIKTLTDGDGADVVLDAVGGAYTEPALRAIAWNGRLLVVGFASGTIPKIPLNLALLKGCSIVGVNDSGFLRHQRGDYVANLEQIFAWLKSGQIKPWIPRTFPLAQAAEALRQLADRKVSGKVVIRP